MNELVLENIAQNIGLNGVASVASAAKLDFYAQASRNYAGGWIANTGRKPVDVVLATSSTARRTR